MPKEIDYKKICFVIMPFGKKKVDGKNVDFDMIYERIFEPAITAVNLPAEEGGGKLIPVRADKDYFSGNIEREMFLYLKYSRFAIADISGLNANVFYELGVRHYSNESGTAIFRQVVKQPPPFDISHVKAFPYEYKPEEQIKEATKQITKVLTDSLQYNRIDSPIQIALGEQKQEAVQKPPGINVDTLLTDATNAMRNGDLATAAGKYKKAIQVTPANPLLYMELGLLFRNQGKWKDAMDVFKKATELSPEYSEAWRELGIAENKIYNQEKNPALKTGEESLLKAISLNPEDFDAYSSLGGIYKRLELFAKSAEMYEKSVEVSNGHPYPLLNAVILQVKEKGISSITPKKKLYLKRAEIPLQKQVTDQPPYNAPWSFFDLSTINLLNGNQQEAMKILEEGTPLSEDWQIKTHLATLSLLKAQEAEIPGLEKAIEYLNGLVDEQN